MAQHGNRVADKQIELLVRDDGSSVEIGKRLFQQAIVNDKVNVTVPSRWRRRAGSETRSRADNHRKL
jgi:hypothetical protein